jgi:hypothetical protein
MKVTEIITESQVLNEQVGIFLRYLTTALERGSGAEVDAALLWLSKQLVGKNAASAATELGEAWARTAMKMGTSIDEVIILGEKQAVNARIPQTVIDAAKKQATKLFAQETGQATGMLAKLGNETQIVKSWLGSKFDLVDNLLKLYGIAEPIYTCIISINADYARWDSKQDPDYTANPKLLQGDTQHHIDVCVRKILALWAGRKISGFVFGKNGIQQLPFLGGAKMSAMFNSLGAGSKLAFTAWLDSDIGRQAFAEWVVGDTLAAAGFRGVANVLSGLTMTGYNKILTAIGSDKAPPPVEPMAPSAPRPGQTRYDFSTGRPLN